MHLYGSKAEPEAAFGEEVGVFYDTVSRMLPGADALNRVLIGLWNPETLAHQWTLPDGFDVHIKVMGQEVTPFQFLGNTYEAVRNVNAPSPKEVSLAANIIHSLDGMVVREMVARCMYSPQRVFAVNDALRSANQGTSTHRRKDLDLLRLIELEQESGFMSARFLDLVDYYNVGLLSPAQQLLLKGLIDSLPEEPFELLTIHDCFRCHPNFGNDIRQQYVNILAELSSSTFLECVARQLGSPVSYNRAPDTVFTAKVRNAEYALC